MLVWHYGAMFLAASRNYTHNHLVRPAAASTGLGSDTWAVGLQPSEGQNKFAALFARDCYKADYDEPHALMRAAFFDLLSQVL